MEAFTMRAGARRAREMVESGLGFDGVFCVTDTVAMGVLRGLADAGVRVPEQVKVIGFDNVESSEFLVPSLSTIDPDHGAMAERAVALLARRIGQAELPQDREEFGQPLLPGGTGVDQRLTRQRPGAVPYGPTAPAATATRRGCSTRERPKKRRLMPEHRTCATASRRPMPSRG
ncbi:substrate-binding domain-containing protein [Streptomyces canus]|uniref:substrate-binding domain-containing protein n=1 Tax=Streptomyces canus TaxID=58343 RepID=UPI00324E77A2